MKKAHNLLIKTVAFFSAAAVLISALTVGFVGFAQTETEPAPSAVWSGEIADSYAGGEGTETDPYLIATGEQLIKMAQDTSSSEKYYKLTCDIILNDTSAENWKDTATQWIWSNNIFKGNFNGDGHTISGLYYNGDKSKIGLLCYAANATVKRVIMENVYIHSTGYATGAVIGDANSGTVTLQECYVVNADIASTGNNGNNDGAGGIIGYGGASITVKDSAFINGSVSAPKNVGAILGNCWSTKVVKNSFSNADMKFCSKQDLSTGSANNYGVGSYTQTGVAFITADKMRGDGAKQNMPNLDWGRYWKTSATGYPEMKLQGTMSEPGDVWTGNVATEYAGGTGTAEDPYLISTGEHLAKLTLDTDTDGKYYKLTHDIILNDTSLNNWKTYAENWVCSTSAAFRGNLDGNGFTVKGLYYYGANSFVGLFSDIAGNATFKNLTVTDASVTTTGDGAGIFAGRVYADGAVKFDHCYITDTVDTTGREGAGGFIAYGTCASVTFNACGSFAAATATYRRAGSFLGNLYYNSATARKITVNSCIAGSAYSNYYVGNDASFTNSYCATDDTVGITSGVIGIVTLANMKGEAAKTNMPKLDWIRTWKTDENGGYPRPIIADPNGIAGAVWSGNTATKYAGGTGTEEDPYLIATGEQLAKMVTTPTADTQGKYYKLIDDIKLNDTTIENWKNYAINWVLNDKNSKFSGTLDGDGHKIIGLYYEGTEFCAALMRYAENAIIKRVYMADVHIKTSSYGAATFVGVASGNIKLVECYVDEAASISSSDSTNNAGAAGFVGYGGGTAIIEDSAYLGTVDAPKNVGTFLGNLWATGNSAYIVKNSFSAHNVKFFGKSDRTIGTNSENNYGTGTEAENGVTLITADKMTGLDAKANMPLLDWGRTWVVNENGYPLPIFPNPNGTAGEVWTGNIAVKYNGGDGTKENPYQIATAEQLAKMMNDTESEGKYYKLTYDIKLNDTSKENWKDEARKWYWTNIFKGNFNGDGYVISGLYYNGDRNNVGLFNLTENAVIEMVILRESYLYSKGFAVGAVVGQAYKGKTTLSECYIEESVEVESAYYSDKENGGDMGAGGLVGYGGAAVAVNGSAFLGTVKAPRFAGAILGNCWGTISINNCFSSSDVKLCTKQSLSTATSDNNYSTCTEAENGVISIARDKMIGDKAMENMSGLDWGRVWKTTADSFPICKFTEEPGSIGDIWSGAIAESYAGGTGTAEDPYLIENGEQLAKLVADTESASKYYKLTADIKLNDTSIENWRYYGRQWVWSNSIFSGNLDGDGHKITGLYYNGTKSKVGLFAYAADAVISQIVIDESFLHSAGYGVGAIVGDANSGTVTLSECYVGENVDIESTYAAGGDTGAGGLIGYGGAAVTVEGSAFLGKVKAPINAGAILGNCWGKDENGTSALIVKHTYSPSALKFCSKQSLSYASDNNYSANAEAQTGVIYLESSKMSGKDAITNMPALDWGRYWKVNNSGYPICRFGDELVSVNAWSGEVATEYAGGSGTKEDPYLISNGEQLAKMVLDENNEGKYYKQTTDINLNDISKENWKDTAKQWIWTDNVFKGIFDGGSNTIRGLYYNGTKSKVGLFCYAANAVMDSVILDNAYIRSTGYAIGTLVGDANTGKVSVTSCYVGEDVYVESTFDTDQNAGAGGFIGYGGAEIEIIGCAFLGTVKAPSNAGAILGNCWGKNYEGTSGLTIKNSYSNSSLKFCSKQLLSGSSADNYSAGPESETGVYNISAEDMKGPEAKENMKALNWFRYWKTTEGYPMIDGGMYEGVSGEVWSGRIAENYAGGSGTEKDPYLISTGEQLAKLLEKVTDSKGKYYKLTADIYLNDVNNPNWEKENPRPWYYVTTARYGNFNGHFDGDGHVVHGLYLDVEQNSSVVYAGLFPTVSDGTVIEKTGISNAHMKVTTDNIDWQSYIGGFAGLVFFNQADEETDPDNLTVFSQCFGDSTVVLEGRFAGGIVAGGPRPANIENCYFIGEVIGERVAAIIGNTWNDFVGATVTKSYGATMAEDIFCGGRSGVQNSATSYNYVDNYTNATGAVSGHAIQISLLMMRGESAKKNMPALDFENIWHALPNGTPVLKIFGTTDKYSNISDPEPIEISFVSNGGTECESVYGNPEEKLTLPIPKKEGYEFGGWYVYRELDIAFDIDYFPYFDQILYAKWIPLGIIQDFESYTNSIYDLGMDYEYYRPGTIGYDAQYVRSGMASVHRIGAEDCNSDFLINYEDMLTVGKKYNMSFWVITDKADTSVKLSLIHEDWPDVYDDDSGVEEITQLNLTNADEWTKVEFTFIARTQWIAIRTSGQASIFFDDFMAIPESDKIYPIGDIDSETEEDNDQSSDDGQSSDNNFDDSSDKQVEDDSNAEALPDNETQEEQQTDNSIEEIPEEDDDKKTTTKVIKKIRKKRKNNKNNDNNLIWIISGISASVVVLAAATVVTFIVVKKRKSKRK